MKESRKSNSKLYRHGKRAALVLGSVFLLMNIIAFFHAYHFTHFSESETIKTKDARKLSLGDKVQILLTGVRNPRPETKRYPEQKFEIIRLQSNNTLLVDFMGSGASQGNQTTVGFKEAEEVKTAVDYLYKRGEKNVYLFGTSMGAVAILKAVRDTPLALKGIILECPFGTLYQTLCARFDRMHIPSFPMAGLLVFWGGVQNGFNAFGHRPVDYAKVVLCPVLLLYGAKDEKVSRSEIDAIYRNLPGKKRLSIYPLAGHENYLTHYRKDWTQDIQTFLHSIAQ